MNRIAPPRVALVLAACAAIAACSGGSAHNAAAVDGGTVDGEITSCPPAPLEGEFEGRPCHDPQLGCYYYSPMGFATSESVICPADVMGVCSVGSQAGTFQLEMDAVECCATTAAEVSWCGQAITEGAPCNEPDNSECVLPDESATCACDMPGPVWRCAPIDGGIAYCPCTDMNVACQYRPDAGAG